MCLPVSYLFWVSSLAYPNLLRTKGVVVVVVGMDVEPAQLTLVKKDSKLAWLGSLMKLAKKASSSWLVSGSSQLV
jgi:hypothetical protein